MKHNIKHLSKFVQNPSKIDQKTIPFWWKCVFGAFSVPNRTQVGSKTLRARIRNAILSIFEILFGIMGPFSAPQEIADRSKIVLLSIDGHFDPRKMPSGRGFGKNSKIEWKIDAKIEGFWWLRTTFGVILFAYFTLLPFSKNIEKSMQKGMPKVGIFGPTTDPGRPRVDWFYYFRWLLKIRKMVDFSMSL